MSAIVFEHIKASELPDQWAEKLHAKPDETFTVIIEAERASQAQPGSQTRAAFGMWRDREDIGDVAAYVRRLRQPRF